MNTGEYQLAGKDNALSAPDIDTYISILVHRWSKTLTTLGFTLIPLFFLLDTFMMPEELLSRFAVYRGVTTAIVIVQFLVIVKTKPGRFAFVHGYLFSLVVGFMIALMTTDLGGFNSTYYAGLNLVMIAVNLLLPWDFFHSAINSAIIIGLYVGLNIVIPQTDDAVGSIVINNLYFLSATAVIAVSINFVKQKVVKQEFYLRNDLKSARDALWGEMEVAKQIQTSLLPTLQRLRGYKVAATMLPADEVGGDYYDVNQSENGEIWLSVGDVSGHGVESGLIMMMTQTSLFTSVNRDPDRSPSAVLGEVNDVLKENISRLGADRYMTLTTAKLSGDTMTFAGKHQDILIYRRSESRVETVATTGTWIGIVDDIDEHLEDLTATVEVGDTILFYTDGVTEAANSSDEMFGEERLQQCFSRYAGLEVNELVASILRDVQEFMAEQYDDLTLVAARRVSDSSP